MEPGKAPDSPIYNSRIADAYLRLVKKKYPHVDINEVFEYAGIKDYEVADQSHWFTRDQIIRFQEKLVQLTGNRMISREAGRYAASVDALGALRQYILGFIGAAHFFELWVGKAASNLTKSSTYASRRIAPNKVVITVTPVEEGIERSFQCENRLGFIEAIVFMYTKKTPTIHHPECMFTGGKQCRYEVSWANSMVTVLHLICNTVTIACLAINAAFMIAQAWPLLEQSLVVSLLLVLLVTALLQRQEKKELMSRLENANETKDNLLDQMNLNYNNAQMTNEIGQGLGSYTDIDDIFSNLINVMQKRLSYDRGLVFLSNQECTRLVLRTGYGFSPAQMHRIRRLSFHLDRPVSKGIFVRAFREQRPFVINDIKEIKGSLSPRSLAFARKIGTASFVCCPIICDGKSLGILAVDNVRTKQVLVESDISLLMGIASVLAISIRNVELLDGRVRVFRSIVEVLAASIDARDPLTAGHSQKVTEYSVGICNELSLSPDVCNVIRVAALLHDYGKLGVPDTILKKKGALTAEEYEIVKAHSGRTSEILSKIDFQGMYCEVPAIAGSHHEKLNGSGYPKGLRGEDIPLGARIIAVADYFEAVTAKRHYHEPMPATEAFVLLREEVAKGHLESHLVDAMISYYTRTYWNAPAYQETSDPVWPGVFEIAEGGDVAEVPAGV